MVAPQCHPRGCSRPFTAYLADPLAVGGVAPLLRQKRAVERLAAALGGHVARWGVDSGRRYPNQRCGDAILRLLDGLRRGETLLVEAIGVLGADREAVEVLAGTMAMLGVAVLSAHDMDVACGEEALPARDDHEAAPFQRIGRGGRARPSLRGSDECVDALGCGS